MPGKSARSFKVRASSKRFSFFASLMLPDRSSDLEGISPRFMFIICLFLVFFRNRFCLCDHRVFPKLLLQRHLVLDFLLPVFVIHGRSPMVPLRQLLEYRKLHIGVSWRRAEWDRVEQHHVCWDECHHRHGQPDGDD